MRIAVHGAGVAGPTLAWWLRHHGHEPVLFEKAPALRTGGYVIDFWGTGYDVAERMGLLPAIHAAGFQAEELRVEDADGRRRAAMGLRTFLEVTDGRYTSIQRGELARIVWEACAGIETRFGTSIDALEQRPDGVRVHSAGRAETFDLVVGTDGLHSRIRTLAFGPEEDYLHPLGLHVAAFRARGTSPRDPRRFVVHTRPGRQLGRVACGEDETAFIFIWRDESDPIAVGIGEGDSSDPVATVERVFADMGWEWPAIRELLRAAPEVYLDGVSQIRMERWTRDRVALVGDAAACVSLLAGEGTGLAMTEAYVLAGELSRAPHPEAFAAYEERLRPLLQAKQAAAPSFAGFFAPRTRAGLFARDWAVRLSNLPGLARLFAGASLRDDFDLPDYPSPAPGHPREIAMPHPAPL
ncbi:MAG: hypothetical protein CMN30_34385 [Sandaracinus sp.]|nr:hypothetical protein [Sandaracinus sp.]